MAVDTLSVSLLAPDADSDAFAAAVSAISDAVQFASSVAVNKVAYPSAELAEAAATTAYVASSAANSNTYLT